MPVALPSLLLTRGGGDLLSERPPCPHACESLVESSLKRTGLHIAFPAEYPLAELAASWCWAAQK